MHIHIEIRVLKYRSFSSVGYIYKSFNYIACIDRFFSSADGISPQIKITSPNVCINICTRIHIWMYRSFSSWVYSCFVIVRWTSDKHLPQITIISDNMYLSGGYMHIWMYMFLQLWRPWLCSLRWLCLHVMDSSPRLRLHQYMYVLICAHQYIFGCISPPSALCILCVLLLCYCNSSSDKI